MTGGARSAAHPRNGRCGAAGPRRSSRRSCGCRSRSAPAQPPPSVRRAAPLLHNAPGPGSAPRGSSARRKCGAVLIGFLPEPCRAVPPWASGPRTLSRAGNRGAERGRDGAGGSGKRLRRESGGRERGAAVSLLCPSPERGPPRALPSPPSLSRVPFSRRSLPVRSVCSVSQHPITSGHLLFFSLRVVAPLKLWALPLLGSLFSLGGS